MTTYIEGYKTYINGNVIQDDLIKAKYDGKNMAIDIYDNGKRFFTTLNNQDISNILSKKAHALPLERRLMKDFAVRKTKRINKYKKNKKNKKKTLKR
uniref:Uncharacterized protein n=1 Tax=viral metagenome TaxID=1070528 RepID=A0A6C0II51_9ZZZZ